MDTLTERIHLAQSDTEEMNALITEYLPFIKAEVGKISENGLEYEDKLSLGMLVFMNCVQQYQDGRGGFIPFASVCIRNRILDEAAKIKRVKNNTCYFTLEEGSNPVNPVEDTLSLEQYNLEQERSLLQEEIRILADKLEEFQISFSDLPRICPKQKRSRKLSAQIAYAIKKDPALYESFLATKRLPQSYLSSHFTISPKTIEKHRKYIVALVIILSGEYPGIGSYIQEHRGLEE